MISWAVKNLFLLVCWVRRCHSRIRLSVVFFEMFMFSNFFLFFFQPLWKRFTKHGLEILADPERSSLFNPIVGQIFWTTKNPILKPIVWFLNIVPTKLKKKLQWFQDGSTSRAKITNHVGRSCMYFSLFFLHFFSNKTFYWITIRYCS